MSTEEYRVFIKPRRYLMQMMTYEDLQNGVMRDLMRELCAAARMTDKRITEHLAAQTRVRARSPTQRSAAQRALRAQAAAELHAFVATITVLAREHEQRFII